MYVLYVNIPNLILKYVKRIINTKQLFPRYKDKKGKNMILWLQNKNTQLARFIKMSKLLFL